MPIQTGTDQVPDLNVYGTVLKDQDYGTMPAGVDGVVADYLTATGAPPGCAIGIMQNNSVAYLKGYGLADLTNATPFLRHTMSGVGSISKTFTALAVMRLKEMGYLNLSDSVSDHLSSYPDAWADITIDELLSHSSGLQRDPVFNPTLATTALLSTALFGYVKPYLGMHPLPTYLSYLQTPVIGFEPGGTARYSNAGFCILGAIIDTIVKANHLAIGNDYAAYESFVWRYVGLFDGLSSNGDQLISLCLNEDWRRASGDIPLLAKGYEFVPPGGYVETNCCSDGPDGWEGPAGGWLMTIGDLTRLMVAIQNNDIVSAASKAQMMVHHSVDPELAVLGYGFIFATKLGRPVYMHDGKIGGYRARYTVWPNEGFGVAIMANEADAGTRSITDDIATLFIGPGPLEPEGPNDPEDPGLGGEVSNEPMDPPGDELTPAETAEILQQLDEAEDDQLVLEQQRVELGVMLEDCVAFAPDLILQYGNVIAVPFLQCYDNSQSEAEYQNCIAVATADLVATGVLTEAQGMQIEQCATAVYRFPCYSDIAGDDDIVGIGDFLLVLASWGGPAGDVNGDGTTDILDFLKVLADWGPCP